jgi:hypothetical protein
MVSAMNLVIYLDALLFLLGMATFIVGVYNLSLHASVNDIKTVAVQTARLAQKGLAEDMAGLVGNASALLDSMNQLVRTTRGVGIFLSLLGLALMSLATWFALKIYQVQL